MKNYALAMISLAGCLTLYFATANAHPSINLAGSAAFRSNYSSPITTLEATKKSAAVDSPYSSHTLLVAKHGEISPESNQQTIIRSARIATNRILLLLFAPIATVLLCFLAQELSDWRKDRKVAGRRL